MLSGKPPFHCPSIDDSAAAIMSRIKEGDFNFKAEAWNSVSIEAKQLIKGKPSLAKKIISSELNCPAHM